MGYVQLFDTSLPLEAEAFMALWLEIRSARMDQYQMLDGKFSCLINEREIATFDGANFQVLASLTEESRALLKSELERLGFFRPLKEEVVYFPISRQIEAESYVSNYSIINEEDEVVASLRELGINEGIKALATRRNEYSYEINLNVVSEAPSAIQTKRISRPQIKTALVCLCFGFLTSLEALAEDKNKPISLEFRTEREEQFIKYKKIIDKHIVENHSINRDMSSEQFGQKQVNMNRAANNGVREIINKDFKFEQRLRNKLDELEERILGTNDTTTEIKGKNITTSPSENVSSTSGFKIKTKNRILQGKAQVKAEYGDYVKMEVEANALASDKVRANVRTKAVSFKQLGMQVYGQIRYASSDQTVVSGINSVVGDNVNFSIYNRKTQKEDQPADENVIEMRYQLDF